jgi:branched-chain amino acid transport system substrate-binding protein
MRTSMFLMLGLAGLLLVSMPARAADELKIGAILAVTGPAANLGGPEARTAEMLVEELNAGGGIQGHKVKLILKDSGGNPEKAVSFCKQLIEEEKVLAIIGPSTSGETLQIKTLCEESQTILISCAAAEKIVIPLAKYVFKVPQKDSQGVTLIYRTMKQLGIARIGVVADNSGYGQAGKEQLLALAATNGITIAAVETYDKGATDLTDILTKIKGNNVQAIVNWSIVPAQSIIPRNLRQMGFNVPLFQSLGFGNPKYVQQAGEAAEGIIFPCGRLIVAETLPDDHPQKKVLMKYKTAYEKRFKEDVSTFGGHVVDALLILDAAIAKAGSTDRAKVRDAIEGLQGLVGTAGIFSFSPTDHNGLPLEAFEMCTVKNGKFAVYQPPAAPEKK